MPNETNETRHRQVKYLNNVVEAYHGKLKLRRCYKTVRPTPKPKANTLLCLTTSPLHRVCNRALSGEVQLESVGRSSERKCEQPPDWIPMFRHGIPTIVRLLGFSLSRGGIEFVYLRGDPPRLPLLVGVMEPSVGTSAVLG